MTNHRCVQLIAVALAIALCLPALAQTYVFTPEPGGTVHTPSVEADEGTTITYSITAQDRDTRTDVTPPQIIGDPLVLLFPGWTTAYPPTLNNPPPSGTKLVGWAQSGFDPVLGTRQITATVKLKAWSGPDDPRTVIDPYEAGDSRILTDNSGRRDTMPLGQPLRSPLQQTVKIKKKRGTVEGKVTDANTGLPLGADIWIWDCDPDIPDDFPEIFTVSDPVTGWYETMMYASWCEVACSRDYSLYEPLVQATTVPLDGTVRLDFVLP